MGWTSHSAFPFLTEHEKRIKFSMALQVPFILIGAITLDEAEISMVMLLEVAAYWCMVVMSMVRRNGRATSTDKLVLRWGFLAMVAVSSIEFFFLHGDSAALNIGLLRAKAWYTDANGAFVGTERHMVRIEQSATTLEQVLAEVAKGESVEITRHDESVARVYPGPRRNPSPEQIREAIEGLRRLQERNTLGGLSIKSLIEEGRP